MSRPPRDVHWGQLVCGPPGSGKTTYCRGLHDILNRAGRASIIVNLDPANDSLPYKPDIDIYDLVSLKDVADAYELGPNGGLVFCLEYLEKNFDWLEEELDKYKGYYFIFDCPGQAELYTHHASFANIVAKLQRLDYRLCSVHLVDAHHCTDPSKFLSAALLSLTAMIRLELPHVNVLSKLDMVESYGKLRFGLDFYTELQEPELLAGMVTYGHGPPSSEEEGEGEGEGAEDSAEEEGDASQEEEESGEEGEGKGGSKRQGGKKGNASGKPTPYKSPFLEKYRKLNLRFAELLQDFNLLAFTPISMKEPETVLKLVKLVDKAHGYIPVRAPAGFQAPPPPKGAAGGAGGGKPASAAAAAAAAAGLGPDLIAALPSEWDFERTAALEEKYTSRFKE